MARKPKPGEKNFYFKLAKRDVKRGVRAMNGLLDALHARAAYEANGHKGMLRKLAKAVDNAEEWVQGVEGNW